MSDESLTARLESSLSRINHKLRSQTRRNLSQWGLSHPRFKVLLHVKRHQGLTMTDLTRKLHQAKSGVTGLVDELVNDGYVERYRDEHDRRVVRLALTKKGFDALENVLTFRQALLAVTLQDVPADKLKQTIEVLGLVEILMEKNQTTQGG